MIRCSACRGAPALGYTRNEFLMMQLFAILFFAATIPIAGILAERGRRRAMIWMTLAAVAYGFIMPTLFDGRHRRRGDDDVPGLWADGLVYGPLGTCCRNCSRRRFAIPAARSRSTSPASSAHRWRHMRQPGWRRTTGCSTSAITFPQWRVSLVGLLATKETKDTDLRH